MTISYDQAYKDHCYLWSIGAADDMTGAYVDQDDLAALLKSPTKVTARQCLCNQIYYWFETGPDRNDDGRDAYQIAQEDPTVQEIADRHFCEPMERVETGWAAR